MPTADDFALQHAVDRGLVAAAAVLALLAAKGALDPRALARALVAESGLPFVELGGRSLLGDVLAVVPARS